MKPCPKINPSFITLLLFIGICIFSKNAFCQERIISGNIQDALTKEPIGFASIYLKKSGSGKTIDSSGTFRFKIDNAEKDTLVISYIGYKNILIPIDSINCFNIILILNYFLIILH